MKLDSINYKAITAQPDFLAKIIRINADSDSCFQEMDNLLRSDEGAVSLILRVANSAMYCRGKSIKTIPHAINLLGINVIRSLAILSTSRTIFTQNKNTLIKQHIWQHSLLTALASQRICIEMGEIKLGEEAFVAGLLHDIGKALLFYNYPDKYAQLLEYALKKPCVCAEAERHFLEIDHYEVGRRAILEWKLPTHFEHYTATHLESFSSVTMQNKVVHFLAIANSVIKYSGFGANSLDLSERREKISHLGASEDLCDFLLEDTFMQELTKNEIYMMCI